MDPVGVGHGPLPPLEQGSDLIERFGVLFQRLTDSGCQGAACDVIGSRPQPAGHNDDVRIADRPADRSFEPIGIVTDGHVLNDPHGKA